MSDNQTIGQPATESQAGAKSPPDPAKVAIGQRIIIFSLVIVLVAIGLDYYLAKLPGMQALSTVLTYGSVVISIVGTVMLCRALGYGIVIIILCCAAMFIGILNLIVLAVLNERAMKVLRAAGWKVGFLGSSRPTP